MADDGLGPATRGRGEACSSVAPHVNASLSYESAEQRDQTVERMISCPLAHLTGSSGLPMSAPDSHNRVTRFLSMQGRMQMR